MKNQSYLRKTGSRISVADWDTDFSVELYTVLVKKTRSVLKTDIDTTVSVCFALEITSMVNAVQRLFVKSFILIFYVYHEMPDTVAVIDYLRLIRGVI